MRYKPDKRAIIIDHVGNYARFGLPDADRSWTLEGRKKDKKERNIEDEVKVLQCHECFYTFPKPEDAEEISCPQCGYLFPKKSRKLTVDENVELEKITGFTLDYSSPEECKNMQELQQYAERHGYKKGWCYYQARQRGWIN